MASEGAEESEEEIESGTGIQYSRRDGNNFRDDEYITAVKSGDMETAQRMVKDAAKTAGFETVDLYHGTPKFGWTVYADNNHATPYIYASTNSSVAAHYAGDNHYAFDREIGEKYDTSGTICATIV